MFSPGSESRSITCGHSGVSPEQLSGSLRQLMPAYVGRGKLQRVGYVGGGWVVYTFKDFTVACSREGEEGGILHTRKSGDWTGREEILN